MINKFKHDNMKRFISCFLWKSSNILFKMSLHFSTKTQLEEIYLCNDSYNNIKVYYRDTISGKNNAYLLDFLTTETSIYKNPVIMRKILRQLPNFIVDKSEYSVSHNEDTGHYLIYDHNKELIGDYDNLLDIISEADIIQNLDKHSFTEITQTIINKIKTRKIL